MTVVAALASSHLVITNPQTNVATSLIFLFQLNVQLEQAATITLVLPSFTLPSSASPSVSGCGTTIFSASGANSGTASAALTLTAGMAALSAGTNCTMSITGVTTSPAAQPQDYEYRTVAVTGGSFMINASSILSSSAVTSPTGNPWHPFVSYCPFVSCCACCRCP